jgi:hypothetical protein
VTSCSLVDVLRRFGKTQCLDGLDRKHKKTVVRTSNSLLTTFRIDEYCHIRCDVVQSGRSPATFRKNAMSKFLRSKTQKTVVRTSNSLLTTFKVDEYRSLRCDAMHLVHVLRRFGRMQCLQLRGCRCNLKTVINSILSSKKFSSET